MLTLKTIIEIQGLLEEGELSRRAIAARLGVSRGTVNAVANGQRGIWGKIPEDEKAGRTAQAERCHECGYSVYKPCIICEARRFQDKQAILRRFNPRSKAA